MFVGIFLFTDNEKKKKKRKMNTLFSFAGSGILSELGMVGSPFQSNKWVNFVYFYFSFCSLIKIVTSLT